MQNEESIFPQDVFTAHLTVINEINFTRREIDIMACLLCARGTSKIASFLSISPKTVVNHIRNIMVKVGTNSRAGIINFIERSPKFFILRGYYSTLIIHSFFEKCLKRISVLKYEEYPSYFVLSWEDENLKNTITHFLKSHMAMANVQVELLNFDSSLEIKKLENQDHTTLILIEKKNQQEISKELLSADFIDLGEQQSYYFFVFEILKKFFQNAKIENIFAEFKEQFENRYVSFEQSSLSSPIKKNKGETTQKPLYMLTNKKWQVPILFFVMIFLGIGLFLIKRENNREIYSDSVVRSELVVPMEAVILHRPELMNKIDEAYKEQEGIRSIALVGIGGAGKTILAREYANQQKNGVLWEFNAEDIESLRESFEGMAEEFAKTEVQKSELRNLQNIKDPLEKEERILQYVKRCLKSNSDWFLIYDNVEDFSDIQKYYPIDSSVWGEGKILLTTRDGNIKNNNHVNYTVSVGELDPLQKLALLTKITSQEENFSFTAVQIEEAKQFLKQIPSYPLDVSVSSHYLKTENISYAEYIDRMNLYNKEFDTVQENIIKEMGDNYGKTRSGIISVSLQYLINAHKDFAELLLLISLLDSRHIPRALLDAYKSKTIVDNFIYYLKKYSLITNELSDKNIGFTFSIHRSSQTIMRTYLTKIINLKVKKDMLISINNFLIRYLDSLIQNGNFYIMKRIIKHCESFINYSDLLNNEIKYIILGKIGILYYYMGQDNKAKDLLEKSLSILCKHEGSYFFQIAEYLMFLGNSYRDLGDYQKAQNLLEQSLNVYKKHPLKNINDNFDILLYLGHLYRIAGHYKKSKKILEECLVKLNKNHAENHVIGWSLEYLGALYKDLGEYEKSINIFKRSLLMFEDSIQNNVDFPWILDNMGAAYRGMGMHEKSKEAYEKSIELYEKKVCADNIYFANCLGNFGLTYINLKQQDKAREFLTKSIKIFEQNYGYNHVETARVIRAFGLSYLAEGNYEQAEKHLQRAVEIFQKSKHSDIYMILEDLAELNLQKSDFAEEKGGVEQSKNLKLQAVSYFNKALEVAKTNFPDNSPHIKRIQSKLKEL